jgi:RNA polymerase sigma-70 factor (ECF subfamily)
MRAAITNVVSSKLVRNQDEYYFKDQRLRYLTDGDLNLSIQGCVLNDRMSQKKIYSSFYNYAMTICSLYTNNYEDSVEILNDGFLKVFKEIYRFQPAYANVISSFKGWLRKIMIHTAIDHFRKNHKYRFTKEVDSETIRIAESEDALDRIAYDEIVRSMQKLTPGYRIIFNLFIIENFSHEEIAKQLGISIGTSKSNLARGRKQLQKILLHENQIKIFKREDKHKSMGVRMNISTGPKVEEHSFY